MLNIHKSIDEDLKVKSYIEIKSNRNSRLTERKSSIISLNSNESKTVIVKRQLQPSIREILDDTPPKGQCYTFM